MFRISASIVVLATVLATGFLTSCGGGGSSSKHDFASKADKICGDVSRRVTELNKARPQSVRDLTRFIEQLKVTVNDGIKRLKALALPTGSDGTTARQFTETADREYKQRVLPALNQLERAVVKRDKKALRTASAKLKQAQAQKQSNLLAAQLGASQCANA